uniref:B-cell linker protein isoform X2 n=1 Tax=Semicossyphus pulcher TaxID=241346 RepID=UPI0037E8B3B7
MNMETLGKLAAPATAKIRQLQKIVQDIRKNDGSLLNKLRRLKNKPVPKVPARDYRDDGRDFDDQLSDPEYDNDTYEDPHEEHDDSYEPPPSHRAFTATPSPSFPRGEYVDNCRNRPEPLPRKPPRPVQGKASKQLPPEPPHRSDEEDYINPDGSNDDDNYIEPEEDPPSNPAGQGGIRAGRDLPKLPSTVSVRPPSPDVYEVPDQEENSLQVPVSRLLPTPSKPSPTLPPKPSPRFKRKSPPTVQEPTGEDEYEVCDPDDGSSNKPGEGRPKVPPKPLPIERSPKPPARPRTDLKPREFERHTLPVMNSEPKPQHKAFTLDSKRAKIPLPLFIPPREAQRGNVSNEDGSADKEADVYRKSWYGSTCDRKTADDALLRSNKDGSFMVRKSSGQDAQQPYTLVVLYKSRVYNIPIRFILATQQYALGREKKGEEHFSSVAKIIENHQRQPLVLIDSQSNNKDATKLCHPVRP